MGLSFSLCLQFFQSFVVVLIDWLFNFMCIGVYTHMSVWESVPWSQSYRQLWDTMLILGIEPRSSGRATSDLNRWAISLPSSFFSLKVPVVEVFNFLVIFITRRLLMCIFILKLLWLGSKKFFLGKFIAGYRKAADFGLNFVFWYWSIINSFLVESSGSFKYLPSVNRDNLTSAFAVSILYTSFLT